MTSRIRRLLLATIVCASLGAGCVADDVPPGAEDRSESTAATGDLPWASEAVTWHEARIRKLGEDGGVAWEYFWDPSVEFDYQSMFPGSAVLRGAHAFAFMQQLLPSGGRVSTDHGPLYVSTDGAVFLNLLAWDRVADPQTPRTAASAQLANIVDPIGPNGAKRMRSAFSTRSWREQQYSQIEVAEAAEALARRWLSTWSGGRGLSPVATASLYVEGARLTDSIVGVDVTGPDQVSRWADDVGPIEWTLQQSVAGTLDVYPLLSTSFTLDGVLMIVEGDDGRACPGRLAVHLTLDAARVATETHYREIADVRRCVAEDHLPDGWWSRQNLEFDEPFFPSEDLETVTGVLDVAGNRIELHNSSERLDELVEWGLGRFAEAGLPIPVVRAVTFTQYQEFCSDVRGRAIRAGGEWSIYLCFHEAEACSSNDCEYFRLAPKHVLLHELAHPWLDEFVGDDTRAAFIEMTGLAVWSDGQTAWSEQAREHAAETIVWGLFDTPVTMFAIGSPDDETLAVRFGTLTGAEPLQGANQVVGG